MATGHRDWRKLITDLANKNTSVPQLQLVREDPDGFIIDPVDEHGAVNYIMRIASQDGASSVVIKYGETNLRAIPGEEISLERQKLEYDALLFCLKLQPASVPEPFCFDKEFQTLVLEDLSHMELLEQQLARGCVDPKVPVNLGKFLAKLHSSTSEKTTSKEEWDNLLLKFSKQPSKEVFGKHTYEWVFEEDNPLNTIVSATKEKFLNYIKKLKKLGYFEKTCMLFNGDDCLIHADCHGESIFVKDGHVRLFDYEYGVLGPPSQNVAYPLAAYVKVRKDVCNDHRKQYLEAGKTLLETYFQHQQFIGLDPMRERQFLTETALFLGAVFWGTAVHYGLQKKMDAVRQEHLLDQGYNLMLAHMELTSVEKLLDFVSTDRFLNNL